MNILKRTQFLGSAAAFLLAAASVVSTLYLQSSEIKMIQNASTRLSDEHTLRNNAELQQRLKMIKGAPSFGFRSLMADGVFLSFIQYFSNASEKRNIQQHLSPDFFEVIIALDPFYRDFYLFLSSSTTMYAAQPQKTVEIMAEGLAAINTHPLPDSFYIWRYKGVDELLFLGDSKAAQHSFEHAAEWADRSDAPESEVISRVSRQTSFFLANDPESTQAQIAAWSSVLSSALNDTIRNEAVRRIQELGATVEFGEDGSIQIKTVETSDSSKEKKRNG